MKHFYKQLILCIVIFLLIFILFNISNTSNISNISNKEITHKEGLDVGNTKKLLSYSTNDSITSNFSYLFVNLRKKAVILDSTNKISFMPINYTYPSCSSAKICSIIDDNVNAQSCIEFDQQGIQNIVNSVNKTLNEPVTIKSPTTTTCTSTKNGRFRSTQTCVSVTPADTKSTSKKQKINISEYDTIKNGSTISYNVLTNNNIPITTNKYNNNYNGNFMGLDHIMIQMIREIFRLTLIESNIIYSINRNNAISTENGGLVFSGTTDPQNLINNTYNYLRQVNSEDTAKILSLGAFKINNIQNKTIGNIMDDIIANDYTNVSTYFDDNIIYDPNADIQFKSNLNYDNNNNILGTYRAHINNHRNSLIYKLCLMSKLYIQGNIKAKPDKTVYDELNIYLDKLKI